MKSEASDQGLLEDIVEVEKALELFLNSRFKDAEELLMPKYGKSMYFTEGIALLRTLRAVMTFDPDDMSVAIESLGYASDVAGVLRKAEKTSVMGILSGAASIVTGSNKDSSYLTGMSRVQKHAELVYAECSVMQSSLTLVSNTNLVSFVKEGMQMRASFAVIKACFKFLDKIYEEEGVEGYAAHSIDEHFTSGVVMNAGILALVLSFLPAKIIKVFEIMGFAGDRDIALDRLSTSAECGGLRKSFSELILFSYHIILASLNPLPDTNLPLATAKLDACLANRSQSFIYRALKARMLETQARPKEAEAEYAAVVALQRDYQQLYHACLWDMGMCRMAQMKWAEAFEGYSVLFEESQWTRTVYRYTQAVTLYSLDPKDARIVDMMKEVPGLVRKIAGITVPLEKFVSRKSKKFLKQGNRLLFPAYEILYFFHGL
ncbi:outer membrane protein Iml2/Tetratricopeptide repeat protein 39, partial [Chytriomyces cf. hyalinus JEL632]